jgi:hypothetical protein
VTEQIEIDPERILEGQHVLELRVKDSAGNETVQKLEYSWGRVSEATKRRTKSGAQPGTDPLEGKSEANDAASREAQGKKGKNRRDKKRNRPEKEKNETSTGSSGS